MRIEELSPRLYVKRLDPLEIAIFRQLQQLQHDLANLREDLQSQIDQVSARVNIVEVKVDTLAQIVSYLVQYLAALGGLYHHEHALATHTDPGFMSSEDWTKLNSILLGAKGQPKLEGGPGITVTRDAKGTYHMSGGYAE